MTKRKLLPGLLAGATLASGCSFIPRLEQPALPAANQYPTAGNPDVKLSGQHHAADIPWEKFYTDPSLQALITLALANNRDLRVAVLQIERARATYDIQSAKMAPDVGVSASATRGPNAATGAYTTKYSVGLSMPSWEIDFWGRVRSLKEQALAQYLATEEGRKAAQISLIANIANTWYSLQADEALLALARLTLTTREASVKLSKLRLDTGVASALDYRQAQTLAEGARATLAQLTRQRDIERNALTLLLGQTAPETALEAAKDRPLKGASLAHLPAGLPSELLQRRPDIRQAEQQLIAANANIGAARALFFPNIALTASAGFANTELSHLFSSGSKFFNIGPSLYLPIFSIAANQANLTAAEVNKKIAIAQYEKAIQTAFREVSDALVSRASLHAQMQPPPSSTLPPHFHPIFPTHLHINQ